ncbi:MAG: DUF2490 domain-containing protein [Luteibaculaceae bacterium]
MHKNYIYKQLFVFISSALFSTVFGTVCAQETAPERSTSEVAETGIWNGLYLRGRLSEKFLYYGEHHLRTRNSLDNTWDFAGRMRQIYNRAGLLYVPNEYFNVIVGPTLVWNFSPVPGSSDFETTTLEPRIWHQWLFTMPYIGRVKFYHQFRFEHRWKRDNDIGADFQYTDRYRYKVFAYIPVNKKKLTNKTFFVAPSAEIFMQTGREVIRNHFEDFRVYTAVGYIFNSKYTFFGGHMWTSGPRASGFEFRESHIIRLNLFYNFDLRNPNKLVPNILMGD